MDAPGRLIAVSILGWLTAVAAGGSAMLVSRMHALPSLHAAQIGLGLIGLVGGGASLWVLRRNGRIASIDRFILISIVWGIGAAVAVTPLFFMIGPPVQMAVRTFYCFSAAGALAALTTVVLSSGAGGRTSLGPVVGIWSAAFGLAAVSVNLVGAALQWRLPAAAALPMAFSAMAVVMGIGSGLAIARLRRPPPQRVLPAVRPADARTLIPLFVVAALPFYLNDLANIGVADWRWWLLVDYTAVKLLPIGILWGAVSRGYLTWADLGFGRASVRTMIPVFLAAVLAGTWLDQNGYWLLRHLPGGARLGGMPEITSRLWNGIDLTVGLMLVAVVEETVFRGLFYAAIASYTENVVAMAAGSGILFGLIHWSFGLHGMLVTGVIGALFMLLFRYGQTLWPVVLAHFFVNFVDFADVIPKEWFWFRW